MKQFLIKTFLGLAGQILLSVFQVLVDRRVFEMAIQRAQVHIKSLLVEGNLTDEEKRRTVALAVKSDLQQSGFALRDSLTNLAVELAIALKKVWAGE